MFILEGECKLELKDGTKEDAYKERLIVMPAGLGHRLTFLSDNFRALVIYSPILDEDDIVLV